MTAIAEITRENDTGERPFWPEVIKILQENDTTVLKNLVFQRAISAPNVSVAEVKDLVETIEEAFKDEKRKFTGHNEVNHSLQVFLIGAEIIGLDNLNTDSALVMLGHNLEEDTEMTPADIIALTNERAYSGIHALSHKKNGISLYKDATDKRPFLQGIIEAHKVDPSLQLLALKVADHIAVGNEPLTRGELRRPELEAQWNKQSAKKVVEMELFASLIPPTETAVQQKLGDSIAFTKVRLDARMGPVFADVVGLMRTRRHHV